MSEDQDSGQKAQEPRSEAEIIKDIASNLYEHFTNIVILCSNGDAYMWHSSDETWARGALQRFLDIKRAEDELMAQERLKSQMRGMDDD